MKKLILLVMVQMVCCAVVFAENPFCHFNATVSDANCAEDTDCSTAANCQTTTFTVTCSQPPSWFKAYTTCSGANCYHCASCVTISSTGSTPLLTLSTFGVGCEGFNCCAVGSLNLPAGTYFMKVCLVPCGREVDGEICCSGANSCVAWGVADSHQLSCP